MKRLADQTVALAADAYRQLQTGAMFWLVLAISLLVALSFAAVGITPEGLRIFGFTLPLGPVNSEVIPPATFYKVLFLNLGLDIWLAWAAIILAVISTAGLIPEFVRDGSIDLYLSRPVGRVRLLLTKYVLGLMFVALQAVAFTTAAFLVIGIRGGVWEPGLFWAVPLVTLVFAYLYAFGCLIGLVTGSTVAAVLGTLLVWMGLFVVDVADRQILSVRVQQERAVEAAARDIASAQTLLDRIGPDVGGRGVETARLNLDASSHDLESARAARQRWQRIHVWVLAAKAPLPKTSETLEVLRSRLVSSAELQPFRDELAETAAARRTDAQRRRARDELTAAAESDRRYAQRPFAWSIGTSLLSVGALLALTSWLFARRDF